MKREDRIGKAVILLKTFFLSLNLAYLSSYYLNNLS